MNERVCQEARALLPEYVDRTLPRLRRQLVALHLRRCAACQAEFSAQRELKAGLASLAASGEAPPDGLLETLLPAVGLTARRGAAPRARSAARGRR